MKTSIKRLLGASAVAVAAGAMLMTVGVGAASAAPPSWEPDPGAVGTITFYNASGVAITGGSLSQPLSAFSAGSQVLRAGDVTSALFWFVPTPGVTPANWNGIQVNAFSNYPLTTGPASIQTLSQTHPVTTEPAGDPLVSDLESASPQTSTQAGFQNVYQVRLKTANTGGTQTVTYADADIQVNDAAGTWTQIYPAVAAATTTTLVASPSPANSGQSVTLTATESPAVAGSVVFMDGATALNTTGIAADGTGKATLSTSTLAVGSHNLSAVFTPTDTTSNSPSTGTTTLVVNPPATPTTTTLTITGNTATTGNDVKLNAAVAPTTAPGTVAFFDNGSATPIPGTVTNPTAGNFVLDLPTGLAAGAHSVVAKFTPTDITQFQVSQSAPQAFITQAPVQGACAQPGSVCTNVANIQATVPVGTLVINTPYTSTNPLDLGNLVLSADSTKLQGSATFANIKVTDTRSGNLPWTVTALATNLTDGGTNPGSTISAENLGLTTITSTPGTGFTGTVTPTDNPAANGVAPNDPGNLGLGGTSPHTVAAANHGLGTVTMQGTLSLNAPSSTEPGLFTGTITFTVG